MLWFYLAITSTIIWALTNIIDKYVITNHTKDPIINTTIVGINAGFLLPIIALTFNVIIPATEIIIFNILTGLVLFTAFYFYFKGCMLEEISRVITIIATIPLFVTIFAAIFLGETFSTITYIGILLLTLGGILISLKKSTKLLIKKSSLIVIFSAILFATYDILIKKISNQINFWNTFFWTILFFFIFSVISALINKQKIINTIKKQRKQLVYQAVSGIMTQTANFIFVFSISLGFVTLTSAVTAIQPLIVLIFAVGLTIFKPDIIKEEINKKIMIQKIIAITLMIIGVWLIV